jgi:hypothetical protein
VFSHIAGDMRFTLPHISGRRLNRFAGPTSAE